MKNGQRFVKPLVFLGIVVALLYTLRSAGSVSAGDLEPALRRGAVTNITIADLQGNRWNLADHRGKVIVLNFWATWCPPCRQETPGLVQLANSYREKNLAVLGISMDVGNPKVVRDFVYEFKIPYPVALLDERLSLASTVQALPTTLLIDKHGRLAKTYLGGASESTFRADVDALLRESAE